MGKILLTGFSAFSDLRVYPSEKLIEAFGNTSLISGFEAKAVVLDTSYDESARFIDEQILSFDPDIMISFGVSFKTDSIKLERLAVYVDDSTLSDNEGVARKGVLIKDDGDAAYFGSLPFDLIYDELRGQGIPVVLSNHAGTFVCNNLYYSILYYLKKIDSDTRIGFIHVPPIPSQLPNDHQLKGMELGVMKQAAEIIINASIKSYNKWWIQVVNATVS